MPVGSTSQRSVQVSGFGDYGHLTPLRRLIRFLFVRPAFCLGLPSDSQSPATPLPSANTSPCRVCRGLSPPSRQAHHHSEPDSASHGATRHAWRTQKKRGRKPRPLVRLARPRQACCMAAFSKPNVPFCTSTRMVSLGAKRPDRISFASGFSSSLWIARLSGRAP